MLQDGHRVAVVGAGAAGIAAAAAAALLADVRVDLYESGDDVLPIQRATRRRRLDPHIYGWPKVASDDPIADLPVLDWEAGASQDVQRDIAIDFGRIKDVVGGRIAVHSRHKVVAIRPVAGGVELDFQREPRRDETADGPDGTKIDHDTVDLVLLAFGFGREPAQAIAGVPNFSYWSDAGIPGADLQASASPRFLVSGNGDGGLIDLVAAASADFDHAAAIREIVGQANIEQIFGELEVIDAEALASFRAGHGYDFVKAYDERVRRQLDGMGFVSRMARRLRPGVKLTLQTLKPEAFSIETATLNRLAAYLVMRACAPGAGTEFRHIHGADLAACDKPAAPEYPAEYWFTCGGRQFGVDCVITRRGPDRAAVRAPFENVLAGYEEEHRSWLTTHGPEALIPALAPAARTALSSAASKVGLPPAPYRLRQGLHYARTTLRIQRAGTQIRWSGDIPPAGIAGLWKPSTTPLEVLVASPASALGLVAAALVRLVLHAPNATFVGAVLDWQAYLRKWTSDSSHAENLPVPAIRSRPVGATANATLEIEQALATALHTNMSRWLLDEVNTAIIAFTGSNIDTGNVIGFPCAPDLRAQMGGIWNDWKMRFDADSVLLDRFLCLAICAEDEEHRRDEARVLLGPKRYAQLTRAVAASLAVAAAWRDTLPRSQPPGNLLRGAAFSGHACAAELIAKQPIEIAAASFMWRTEFVLLSHLNTPPIIEFLAQSGFAEVAESQPSLIRPSIGGMFMTLDSQFRAAAQTGVDALTTFFARNEQLHLDRHKAGLA